MDRTTDGTIWRGNERDDLSENRWNWETCPRCCRWDRAMKGSNGALMTLFYAPTRHWQSVFGEARKHFGEKVFDTVIQRTTRLAQAPGVGKPIIHYDKYSAGTAAYAVLAAEVVKRLDLRRSRSGHHALFGQKQRFRNPFQGYQESPKR